MTRQGRSSRWSSRTLLALAAVYFVWGSTYLGLKFGLEGFPPFLLNGARFLVAGGAMYAFLRARGLPAPSGRQWRNLVLTAAFMLVGGVGFVTVAEDLGVGSGVAAAAIAVMPLWAALIGGLFGRWPTRLESIGLFVGFAGVLLLAQEGDFRSTAAGTVLILLAPMSWAFGSMWRGRIDVPGTMMSTAGELLVGGVLLSVLAPLRGERITEMPSLTAWLALAYLIVFGSIVAYSSYVYLLDEVRPAVATSYAYVNPIVAVMLGITLGGEHLSGPVFYALPLILGGVALVGVAQRKGPAHRRRRVQTLLVPADESV